MADGPEAIPAGRGVRPLRYKGEPFDLPDGALLDVERQIMQAVVSELGYELSAAESAAVAEYGTDSDPAHREYLKGIGFLDRRNKQGFDLAIEAFDNAIEHDENYALPWSGLADTYLLQPSWNYVESADARPLALNAAEKALALEPDLAEAHISLASITHSLLWDHEAAEAEFLIGTRLDPGYAPGRYDEALDEFESYGREPAMVAATLARLARTEEARELLASRVAEVGNPDVEPPERVSIAAAYAALGEPDAAFRVLEQAHADQDIVMTLLATDGIRGDAQ